MGLIDIFVDPSGNIINPVVILNKSVGTGLFEISKSHGYIDEYNHYSILIDYSHKADYLNESTPRYNKKHFPLQENGMKKCPCCNFTYIELGYEPVEGIINLPSQSISIQFCDNDYTFNVEIKKKFELPKKYKYFGNYEDLEKLVKFYEEIDGSRYKEAIKKIFLEGQGVNIVNEYPCEYLREQKLEDIFSVNVDTKYGPFHVAIDYSDLDIYIEKYGMNYFIENMYDEVSI